jgi:2-(1,2-epoxy-1,2-dihydrophenyl)acetyl-CoA isomerase
MTAPETGRVDYWHDDSIFHIVLSRPERGNAIDRAMAADFRAAAERCAADDGVRAVLVSAQGRHFCVGGDLAEFDASHEVRERQVRAIADDVHRAQELLLTMNAPVVVAVQGDAAGGGLGLALIGDFVLASSAATFLAHYASIGLSADGGSTFLLPRLAGLAVARDMLLLDRRLTADEALDCGLVSEIHDPRDLAEAAEALAVRLSAGPTAALGAIKRLLLASFGQDFGAQVNDEAALIAEFSIRRDADEGIAAFREKRSPIFGFGR